MNKELKEHQKNVQEYNANPVLRDHYEQQGMPIPLDIQGLPVGQRRLASEATKYHDNCTTCFRYTHKVSTPIYGYRSHNWNRILRHLVAQHGYDPRPWYKRLLATRLTTR